MKVDISRDTFRPQRHYSSVRLEQGRVQVDADWNEQIAINHHHTRTTARDVIGAAGAPKGAAGGFAIALAPDGSDLLIAPGAIYVDGILCELDTPSAIIASYGPAAKQATLPAWVARTLAVGLWIEATAVGAPPIRTKITAVNAATGLVAFADELSGLGAGARVRVLASYGGQPDLRVALPVPPLPIGSALVYLDVWERSITALDDPEIREVALGGTDTATRMRVVWQVKLLPLTGGPFTCSSAVPEYDAAIAAPTGRLSARAMRDVTTDNPCVIPSSSGFRRLENQLYRVEIHKPGSLASGTATFKWSRDNAAVVGRITGRVGDVLTLAAAPRDEALGFASGQWIEISDDHSELAGEPGTLIRLAKVEGKQLTLDTTTGSLDLTKCPGNPVARRWDSAGQLPVATGPAADDGFLRLEDGVQIKLEPGTYATGDYWLIPARTITGDVEWPRDAAGAIPQLRRGTHHHFARLAIATTALQGANRVTTIADCRRRIPPLTEITAEDVAFDSDCDLLSEASTVHEALDVLCHERNLRFHNQQLHGWGIVNGLQVQCGPDSHAGGATLHDVVTVKPGYAIDALGRDIIVDSKTGDRLRVLDMLRASQLLIDPADPGKLVDGSVSLAIQPGSGIGDRYRLELYDAAATSWSKVLDHSFVWDVWQDCLVPLGDAFRSEFLGQDDQTWQHIIAFINVLAPLLLPQNGRHVYISPKEDAILRGFYDKLRVLLQSKTFCAMFDGRGFPDYEPILQPPSLDPRPSTIFGKVLQGVSLPSRMRITPDGAHAFAISGKVVATDQSSIISIFNVAYRVPTTDANGKTVFESADSPNEKLVGSTAFPTSGATVTDVAFSPDARTMYAIAVLNGNDSLFAAADIRDPANIRWSQVTTLCDQPLVALVLSPLDPQKLYAVARGAGLHLIDASGLLPNQVLLSSFLATGHLEVAMVGAGKQRRGFAFCTTHAAGDSPPDYRGIRRVDLADPDAVLDYALPASHPKGNDDICVSTSADGRTTKLFAIVDAGNGETSKRLVRYDAGASPAAPLAVEANIDLQYAAPNNNPGIVDTTTYRLAYNEQTQRVMIASFDAFLIKLVAPTAGALDPVSHPTQLWPIAIAYNPSAAFASVDGRTRLTGGVFVQNALSGTINNIPAAYVGRSPAVVDLAALADYHNKVLEAFIDLFGRFAQYLKDGFCDHFLVNGPDDTAKTVYLARIDIKDQQVYNICNFSRRRYVHSFPTIEYWMSIVPVLPVVRKLVGDACCTIIQSVFANVNAPAAERSDVVSSSKAWNGMAQVQRLDLAKQLSTQLGKLGVASRIGKTMLGNAISKPAAPAAPLPSGARLTDVVNQPAPAATKLLAGKSVTVVSKEVVTSSKHVADTLAAPAILPASSQVVLVTDARDRVLGYRVVKAAGPAVPAGQGGTDRLDAELTKRDAVIAQLSSQLEALSASHDASLAARDKQLAELTSKVATLIKASPTR